jgi:hypothetical protein
MSKYETCLLIYIGCMQVFSFDKAFNGRIGLVPRDAKGTEDVEWFEADQPFLVPTTLSLCGSVVNLLAPLSTYWLGCQLNGRRLNGH